MRTLNTSFHSSEYPAYPQGTLDPSHYCQEPRLGFSPSQSHSLCSTTWKIEVRGLVPLFINSTGHQRKPKLGAKEGRLLTALPRLKPLVRNILALPFFYLHCRYMSDKPPLAKTWNKRPSHIVTLGSLYSYCLDKFDFPINWDWPMKSIIPVSFC